MDGELEDILDWLLLLLLNLLAILSLVLFYSIALSFCAIALHLWRLAISGLLKSQLRGHVCLPCAFVSLSAAMLQPNFCRK